MAIVLNPPTGLRDVTIFDDEPGSSAAAREQIQSVIDQVASQAAAQADFVNSLNTSGYQKLPNGFIVQWVSFTIGSLLANYIFENTYNFPIAFPNAVVHMDCNPFPNSAYSYNKINYKSINKSQYFIHIENGSTAQTFSVTVFAVGY